MADVRTVYVFENDSSSAQQTFGLLDMRSEDGNIISEMLAGSLGYEPDTAATGNEAAGWGTLSVTFGFSATREFSNVLCKVARGPISDQHPEVNLVITRNTINAKNMLALPKRAEPGKTGRSPSRGSGNSSSSCSLW